MTELNEQALPEGCKMRSANRYASDEDCERCGRIEGDACPAFWQRSATPKASPLPPEVADVVKRLREWPGDGQALRDEAADDLEALGANTASLLEIIELKDARIASLSSRLAEVERERDEWSAWAEGLSPAELSNGMDNLKARAESAERLAAERGEALTLIIHTFTEDSHGNTKCLPGSEYQNMARQGLDRAREAHGDSQ